MSKRTIRSLAAEERFGERPRELRLADAGRAEEEEAADRAGSDRRARRASGERPRRPPRPPRPGRRPARAAAPRARGAARAPRCVSWETGMPVAPRHDLGDVLDRHLGRALARASLPLLELAPARRRSASFSSPRAVVVLRRGRLVALAREAAELLLDGSACRRPSSSSGAAPARSPGRSGRSPCRAGSGRGCSGRRAPPPRRSPRPRCARGGTPRSGPSGRAGSRSSRRPSARATSTGWKRRSSAGSPLDVLAVLVERRRADHVQLAARERRLEHVAGVHRALGRAGADDACAARR